MSDSTGEASEAQYLLKTTISRAEIEEVLKAGLDDARREGRLPQETNLTVKLERQEAQFDVATTIAIAIAGGLGKDAIEGIWKSYIWPRLKARGGAKIQQVDAR